MMAGFLQRLVTAGARTLGDISASARPVAKSVDALPEIIEERVVAEEELAPGRRPSDDVRGSPSAPRSAPPMERPLASSADRPMSPPAPRAPEPSPKPEEGSPSRQAPPSLSPSPLRDAVATAERAPAAWPAREERSTAGLQTQGSVPASPAPHETRRAPLRDAVIQVAEPEGARTLPPQGPARAATPDKAHSHEAPGSKAPAQDGLAPFKERWRDLAQRLRMSHPPPLPEAGAAAEEPPSSTSPRAQPGTSEGQRAERGPTPGKAALARDEGPTPPGQPSTATVTQDRSVPPPRQSAPPQAAGARSSSSKRAPELVIGNLEVRIVPLPPAPEPRSASPEPRSPHSGSWQTAARHYLGRL
ncbi:MAG: hypothetical protein JXB05_01010 [Myxococcaceae bacterium]|nr:hypothetical protein [Myxococcaceae bacterium]